MVTCYIPISLYFSWYLLVQLPHCSAFFSRVHKSPRCGPDQRGHFQGNTAQLHVAQVLQQRMTLEVDTVAKWETDFGMVTFPKLNLVIYNFNLLVLSFTWNFLSLKVFNSSFVSCDIYIYIWYTAFVYTCGEVRSSGALKSPLTTSPLRSTATDWCLRDLSNISLST